MKALLVILACLICVALADDCERGPTFWCSNNQNAQRCGAQTYCSQNCWSFGGRVKEFWKRQMLKFNRHPDNQYTLMCTTGPRSPSVLSLRGSVCTDCKVVIADLDKLLKNKQSLESLTAAMRFFCNFLPAYSTLCREIVNDLSDMITELEPMLSDPEAACEKMKMCPKPGGNSTLPSLVSLFANVYAADTLNSRDLTRNNTICDDCQQACHDIIVQLQDPAQQQNIKETFEELCDYVGPLKNKCLQYIDQFVPQLINWIISRFTDPLGLCTQLGFCR